MDGLTYKDFLKTYKKMNTEQRDSFKRYWWDVYKNAVFIPTFEAAEKVLLFVRKFEEGY